MNSAKTLGILLVALCLSACPANIGRSAPLGTAFTYQGQLIDANTAANGVYDFYFWLYDDPSIFGNPVGTIIIAEDLEVLDGHFAVELDFGDEVFDGNACWLEIGVRPGDSNDVNDFVTLSPRQHVTPVPYALYAKSATP